MKYLIPISCLFFIYGCSGGLTEDSLRINPGQSKNQVLKIMGPPGNRQFEGKDEAWQYCQTDYVGFSGDDYVVVWFYDGVVTGLTTYKNYLIGDCSAFYKSVRWEDKPDVTIEHRKR
jgi:hypothetical protein